MAGRSPAESASARRCSAPRGVEGSPGADGVVDAVGVVERAAACSVEASAKSAGSESMKRNVRIIVTARTGFTRFHVIAGTSRNRSNEHAGRNNPDLYKKIDLAMIRGPARGSAPRGIIDSP